MNVVNDFMGDFFERIADTAKQLMRKVGRQTLQARNIAGAVALLTQGELRMFAMTKGLQSLTLTADSYRLDTHDIAKHRYANAVKLAKC